MRSVRDAGSATLWVVGAILLVLVTTVTALGYGTAVFARHRAESAADLAALAAAGQIGTGGDPCMAAADVAHANGAKLQRCEPSAGTDARSGTVRVWVAVSVSLPVVGERQAVGRARAGRGDVG